MINPMLLTNVLNKKRILFLNCTTKTESLKALIDCMYTAPEIENREELAEGIFHREELMSTGIGLGIAVPHVRLASVKDIVVSVGICRKPLQEYESLDGQPINFIFMIVAGKEQHSKYLKLLSSISSLFKDEKLRSALLHVKSTDEFYSIISQKDT